MSRIISASIDLNKINKAKINVLENGQKWYNFSIIVNDAPDKYGKDCSLTEAQTKEERTAKVEKVYIGSGKTVWQGESKPAGKNEAASNNDLPF